MLSFYSCYQKRDRLITIYYLTLANQKRTNLPYFD